MISKFPTVLAAAVAWCLVTTNVSAQTNPSSSPPPCATLAPYSQARGQQLVSALNQLNSMTQPGNVASQLNSCLGNLFNFGPAISLFGFNPWQMMANLACQAVNQEWSAAMSQLGGFENFLALPGGTINVPGMGTVGIPGAGVHVSSFSAAAAASSALESPVPATSRSIPRSRQSTVNPFKE